MKRLVFSPWLTAGRLFNPKKWSLRTRVVYTTGFILLAGACLTLFTISYVLHRSAEQAIENRIDDFKLLVAQHTTNLDNDLLMLNAHLAAREDIQHALAVQDIEELQRLIHSLSEQTDLIPGRRLPTLQFYAFGTLPLFNSRSMSLPGNTARTDFQLPAAAEKKLAPVCGVHVIDATLQHSCALPVFVKDVPVGVIEAITPTEELFASFQLPHGYGLRFSLDDVGAAPGVSFGLTGSESGSPLRLDPNGHMGSAGTLYAKQVSLANRSSDRLGTATLFYDGREILLQSHNTILIMTWITVAGVFLLYLSLYWNVKRIRDFFDQMKMVLIASHSKDFTERFTSDSIHCTTLLNCSHKECPAYQDPKKVCYLETGDEAISPRWRNSCVFLNKYNSCKRCPVFKAQHGDELVEMRHVVNTMMGLWEAFLDKVGILLSDVFRTSSGQMPGLDDISRYLEQMAALTNYSQDLHGVYSKEEVYRLLEWAFEKQFDLTHFTLLEVNSSDNRLSPVISRCNLDESHREVFINCELCRAKRVAQEVISENSPHLCPYFGIDSSTEVRCCMPMVMGGRVGAVFTYVAKRAIWETRKQDIPIIKKYLDETAPILSSLRLLQISKEQALRDPMTQCHNRRFMDEYLIQLEHQYSRKQQKLGFMMADLDHFKMVNDEFGHLAGDEILKQLSVILKQNIRKSDLLIRYGGEEFLVILFDLKDDEATFTIAEKLRAAVEEARFALPAGGIIRKTLSIGTADFPKDAEQFYQAIKYADVALYQAKERGRNKVLRFVPEMWQEERY